MKIITVFFAVCLGFLPFLYSMDKVVAVVNGQVITESELKEYLTLTDLNSSSARGLTESCDLEKKEQALLKLVEDRLIIQKAKKTGIIAPDDMVEQRLNDFMAQFEYRQDFEQSLRERGLNVSDLRERIRDQILMRNIINQQIRSQIDVHPREITSFYQQHKERFKAPVILEYKGFKFSQEAAALQAYEELSRSYDRDYILGRYPANVIKGSLSQEQVRKELWNLFEYEPGSIAGPVNIEGEYYVFWIKEKKDSGIRTLPEVKNRIWEIIYQSKFAEKFSAWIKELKEKAVIEILEISC
jgi:peptidyl-prolyl cis-trans isomerase SurA